MRKILTFLLILPVIVISCKTDRKVEEKDPDNRTGVNTVVVKKEYISIPVQSIGTLASKTQSSLGFLTGGIISHMYVSDGDKVKRNQLLARLDMTEIESRYKQAALAYEKAKRDYSRAENLYGDTVITLEQYQNARTALELAETNYNIADFNRENSEIRAPSDGKILKKLKEINEITAPGYPVLVFASTETDWVLKINLADKDIVRISAGDSAVVTFDAYPGEEFSAVIQEIANAANLMSGTYEVELKLLELPRKQVTGLIGQAKILPLSQELLLLPVEGLVEAVGDKGIVYVLEGGVAVKKEITLNGITNRGIVVTSGLEEGERVISNGNAWIKDGEKVEVKN